jgi:ferredoxin-NADP reductase
MNKYPVKIKSIDRITPDVLKIVTERPGNYTFNPGQATEIAINKSGWINERRPFTFTCLPDAEYLEFTIKTYPSHKGVTNELLSLKKNDELILHDVFGAIEYNGEGVFIAGGAGITPFIGIFRNLHYNTEIGENRLIFANKKKEDIIIAEEFEELLGINFINILSEENSDKYFHGLITESFLKDHMNGVDQHVYLCGPPPMMTAVESQLASLGISRKVIIKEAV